ncbi:ARHGEF10 [Lepeophtheirus salmonis]|uniref:ARHGEF10 n=1 Tax=Lepeophtheirus salmonis TaxID=72036 RepID=A0A7R8CGN6_LEPSM|nr:ARHGEF10 [Lepeophtheirus salmonis]CAF2817196.1 ARHGEF10 [Lepeophtheirus salmonis]
MPVILGSPPLNLSQESLKRRYIIQTLVSSENNYVSSLQRLVNETPPGHVDRMALQLALTTLESLAEMLNERKREAEQFAAFKEKIKSIGGKTKGLLECKDRYLLKEGDLHQLEFNSSGQISRSKARRLLLINDYIICLSMSGRFSEIDLGQPSPRRFIWVSAFNGTSSILKVLSHPGYKELSSITHKSFIKHIEFVPGIDSNCSYDNDELNLRSNLVWISTNKMIIIYSAYEPERFTEITRFNVPAEITSLLCQFDAVWIGLSNGILASLKRNPISFCWDLSHPSLMKISSNGSSINCLLPVCDGLYVSWANIFMSSSGVGLWISLKHSSTICLYHTETFRHLQDINIASNVYRVLSAREVSQPTRSIFVSAMKSNRPKSLDMSSWSVESRATSSSGSSESYSDKQSPNVRIRPFISPLLNVPQEKEVLQVNSESEIIMEKEELVNSIRGNGISYA